MNCYRFIEAEKACRRNVKRACELLKVSRAAFYQHISGKVSQRGRQDAELTGQIQAVHQESRGRYGAPRIHAELARRGRRHGRKRVARLMRCAGICGKTPKRWRKTTIADPSAAARADRVRRDFTADASAINSRWCGDITYIAHLGGLAVPISYVESTLRVVACCGGPGTVASPQSQRGRGSSGDGCSSGVGQVACSETA